MEAGLVLLQGQLMDPPLVGAIFLPPPHARSGGVFLWVLPKQLIYLLIQRHYGAAPR